MDAFHQDANKAAESCNVIENLLESMIQNPGDESDILAKLSQEANVVMKFVSTQNYKLIDDPAHQGAMDEAFKQCSRSMGFILSSAGMATRDVRIGTKIMAECSELKSALTTLFMLAEARVVVASFPEAPQPPKMTLVVTPATTQDWIMFLKKASGAQDASSVPRGYWKSILGGADTENVSWDSLKQDIVEALMALTDIIPLCKTDAAVHERVTLRAKNLASVIEENVGSFSLACALLEESLWWSDHFSKLHHQKQLPQPPKRQLTPASELTPVTLSSIEEIPEEDEDEEGLVAGSTSTTANAEGGRRRTQVIEDVEGFLVDNNSFSGKIQSLLKSVEITMSSAVVARHKEIAKLRYQSPGKPIPVATLMQEFSQHCLNALNAANPEKYNFQSGPHFSKALLSMSSQEQTAQHLLADLRPACAACNMSECVSVIDTVFDEYGGVRQVLDFRAIQEVSQEITLHGPRANEKVLYSMIRLVAQLSVAVCMGKMVRSDALRRVEEAGTNILAEYLAMKDCILRQTGRLSSLREVNDRGESLNFVFAREFIEEALKRCDLVVKMMVALYNSLVQQLESQPTYISDAVFKKFGGRKGLNWTIREYLSGVGPWTWDSVTLQSQSVLQREIFGANVEEIKATIEESKRHMLDGYSSTLSNRIPEPVMLFHQLLDNLRMEMDRQQEKTKQMRFLKKGLALIPNIARGNKSPRNASVTNDSLSEMLFDESPRRPFGTTAASDSVIENTASPPLSPTVSSASSVSSSSSSVVSSSNSNSSTLSLDPNASGKKSPMLKEKSLTWGKRNPLSKK